MSYTLTVTNGSSIVVQNGTIDTSTSLQLVGKNYPSYGLAINQNLIKLLQNSAGTGQPTGALTGQLYWDTTNTVLKIYTGAVFKNITSVISSATQPTNAIVQGDLWFDSSNLQLYVYTGTTWLLVGPSYTSTQQKTTAVALNITDTSSSTHTVLAFFVGNILTGIVSKDSAFSPNTAFSTAYGTGFSIINPGYNINTSIFSAAGTLINGTIITNAQPYITSLGTLTSLSMGGPITTTGTGSYNIGTSANKFGTIYATATNALYADLAENYVADSNTNIYDIMVIGGNEEVTVSTVSHDSRVIGVVSQNPAYLMNSGLQERGTAIALTGRVSVKVRGPIYRGACVVSSDLPGIGEQLDTSKYTPGCIVGKALEGIDDTSIKIIEVVVGVR
jgi:hypothetical protein